MSDGKLVKGVKLVGAWRSPGSICIEAVDSDGRVWVKWDGYDHWLSPDDRPRFIERPDAPASPPREGGANG